MIIATRSLKITAGEKISDVVIDIHALEPARVEWLCRYDIGWPEGKVERYGAGIDEPSCTSARITNRVGSNGWHPAEATDFQSPRTFGTC